MRKLQIDERNARKLFRTASHEFKQTLIDTFGEEFFSEKITDKIKTFEDAFDEAGFIDSNVKILLDYNGVNKDMIAARAFIKLTIISRALNEGWEPDWNNSDECKYWPCFDMRSKPGFGFSYTDCDRWATSTTVGSRLCFKSRELAEYAGTQFADIYKEFLTL